MSNETSVEKHVGFTGTQAGMTTAQAARVNRILASRVGWFHHGDCIGADKQANDMAWKCGLKVAVHPPANPAKRALCDGHVIHKPLAYLQRNRAIVDACIGMIAAPRSFSEELRSGTWATVRYAQKQNKPVVIVFPDGSVQSLLNNLHDQQRRMSL